MTAVQTRSYGDHPEQVADLHLPAGRPPTAGWPVVVLVHGGFWRDRYRRDLMEPIATDLAGRGVASWNLEYRRVGPTGGGVPATLEDVAAAVDALTALDAPLDLERVAVAGHSAGGQLALWIAGRDQLAAGVPGAGPRVRPCLAVGQAAVASLSDGLELGDGAVGDFLGGRPDEVPGRYALADPIELVGHGVPIVLVHGEADDTVPVEQSERYEAAARTAGDEVELIRGDGDHYSVIDPTSDLWAATVDAILAAC